MKIIKTVFLILSLAALIFLNHQALLSRVRVPSRQESAPVEENQPDTSNREIIDGNEYIPINIAELANLVVLDRFKPGNRYRIRGMVKNLSDLSPENQFFLYRPLITCCMADAVIVGLRASYTSEVELPDSSWVHLYGEFIQTEEKQSHQLDLDLHRKWLFKSEMVVPAREPVLEERYIYNVFNEEPFYY